MKFTLKEKKPTQGQVIVFKAKRQKHPEIGIWGNYTNERGDYSEIYIPCNDDSEIPKSIEWWMEIPE